MDLDLEDVLFSVFYLAAIVVVVLHYTGWLEDRNLNWIVFVIAAPILIWPIGRMLAFW